MLLAGVAVFLVAALAAESAAATEWNIEPTPNQSEAEGSEQKLDDVSCFSASFCMAVGDFSSGEASGAWVEVWDGEEWSYIPATSGVDLNDVTCLSGGCVVAGSKGGKAWVELWISATETWWALPVSNPAEATSVVLNGISCVSEGNVVCMVVGSYVKAGEERTLAIRLEQGVWTIQNTPNVGEEGSTLSAVSCASTSDCAAVGYYTEFGTKEPLAMSRAGGPWALEELPVVEGGEDAYLNDVSCVGEIVCVAVGTNGTGWARVGIGMTRSSGVWGSETPAEPSGLEGGYTLNGVSCLGELECQAVGEYDRGFGSETRTLIEEYLGAWSQVTSADPEGIVRSWLSSISCPVSVSDCVAVGGSSEGELAGTKTLALHHE